MAFATIRTAFGAQKRIINLERIEVVKGPPSFLYGRADPGGVINQITKAPLKVPTIQPK